MYVYARGSSVYLLRVSLGSWGRTLAVADEPPWWQNRPDALCALTVFERFCASACATTHTSFPLQLSAHLSECVNAPSTCSFKRYGCVFQVSIRHLSFPITDVLPWEKVTILASSRASSARGVCAGDGCLLPVPVASWDFRGTPVPRRRSGCEEIRHF